MGTVTAIDEREPTELGEPAIRSGALDAEEERTVSAPSRLSNAGQADAPHGARPDQRGLSSHSGPAQAATASLSREVILLAVGTNVRVPHDDESTTTESITPLVARRVGWRSWIPDILGVGWVLAAAGALLASVLVHGHSFGPFDLLSHFGLSKQAGVVIHNTSLGDQVDAIMPWTTLAWRQVHQGQLPLWNPYSAWGMPLAFNWQSAAFSVPALFSYLVPLRLSYTVQVIATLCIAGTGVYVLGRVLRLGVLASVFAATVFELSGPLVGWLGWPHAAVMSWAGWLFAAALLVVRGRHRARDISFFAVVLAFALYAGQPEIAILLGLALVVFLAVLLTLRARWLRESILRPVTDLVVATAAGAALAAPLLLPGLQLAAASNRNVQRGQHALGPHYLVHLVFQGFDGLPVAGNQLFGDFFYIETAAYVGVIALVLALTAVAVRRRQPVVVAFAAVAISAAALVFVPPVVSLMERLPSIGPVGWQRALAPMAFGIAVLAGVGMDLLVRSHQRRGVRRWSLAGFAVAGLALLVIWAVGRGDLPSMPATIRAESFVWPAVDTALGLVVVGALIVFHRRNRRLLTAGGRPWLDAGRWAGVALLICETVFLVSAGAPLPSASAHFFTPTRAEMVLKRAVGSSLVGLGARSCFLPPELGIAPDVNVVYGVHELALYDPIIPRAYYTSVKQAGFPDWHLFCPAVSTATLARRYGVTFVLEPGGGPGPDGGIFEGKVGDEDLYRIPGAGAATVTPLLATGSYPAVDAPGLPLAATHPDPASWRVVTDSASPQVLRLRLTDVPGWHATIDGRALPLDRFSGVMLQARIPAGHHVVRLRYWPTTFTAGIVLAACSVAGLSLALFLGSIRRRRQHISVPSARGAP